MGSFDEDRIMASVHETEKSAMRGLRDVVEDTAEFTKKRARELVQPSRDITTKIDWQTRRRNPDGGESVVVGVLRPTRPAGKAGWVEHGTGIYGPTGMPITAAGNVMVFRVNRYKVFATSVRGQRGKHYMQKAVQEAADVYLPARLAAEKAQGNVKNI